MWYKNAYDDNAEEASDAIDMIGAFRDFYANVVIAHPKDAKGLAMFVVGRVYYFHSNCHFHRSFFAKYGCSHTSQPSTIPEFLYGDEEFLNGEKTGTGLGGL